MKDKPLRYLAIKHLAETRGLTVAAATALFFDSGKERQAAWKSQALAKQAEYRRRAAGNPIYKPRSDFVRS